METLTSNLYTREIIDFALYLPPKITTFYRLVYGQNLTDTKICYKTNKERALKEAQELTNKHESVSVFKIMVDGENGRITYEKVTH